jgi:hypothetical protein
MRHLSDDQLILLFYGELSAARAGRARAHLASCARCRDAEARIRAVLAAIDAPAAEPPEQYAAHLWRRLEPRVRELGSPAPRRLAWRPAAVAAVSIAVVVALVAGVLVGLRWGRQTPPPASAARAGPTTAATPADRAIVAARERILLDAIDEYLAQAERVLVELANAGVDDPTVLAALRAEAEDLVQASRVYRMTASSAGETAVVGALDEIERALVEVARSPADLSRRDRAALVDRLDTSAVLFTLRATADEVRARAGGASTGRRAASN